MPVAVRTDDIALVDLTCFARHGLLGGAGPSPGEVLTALAIETTESPAWVGWLEIEVVSRRLTARWPDGASEESRGTE